MKNDHKKLQWTCALRPHPKPINFESEDAYAEHLSSEHSDSLKAVDIPLIASFDVAKVSRDFDAKVLPSCPMCGISVESFGSDVDKLCRHIAQELFDYALLAIPDQASRCSSYEKGNFGTGKNGVCPALELLGPPQLCEGA